MTRAYGIFGCARFLGVVSFCGLALSAALAQDSNAFNGEWTANFYVKGEQTAMVVIADGGGSWQPVNRGAGMYRGNPCFSRKFPLTVKSHTVNEIVFQVDESQSPGCKDFGGTVKVVDANTLEGKFTHGTPLKLVRH